MKNIAVNDLFVDQIYRIEVRHRVLSVVHGR